ncbi:hypothetical protein EYF80_048664 [Liparis tanakae]|uniref:Uncharacterized protein n=1 Tax=Liparis tanakae TaxID=230148 RepID=A0A4Z2FIZ6_9TELE|nr:hypothetical protein EYF80_048664 [Liparis tanakae]
MKTQVASMPPTMISLSVVARLSMSLITVLDSPSMLATSSIFFVDLWSRSPLRMPLPLPRMSSMPLCALCRLEFNCRVSSMGMEVSASYWTRAKG